MRSLFPWPLLVFVLACGEPDNAVLEVRMRLPVLVEEGMRKKLPFAHVAVLPSDADLTRTSDYESEAQAFDLRKRGCNVELSIVSKDPRAERTRLERGKDHGLIMMVWFCPSEERCARAENATWLIDFDKALWPGERTIFEADAVDGQCSRWELSDTLLPSVQKAVNEANEPAFSMRVPECYVLGCLDESSTPALDLGFCSLDGRHPCDE